MASLASKPAAAMASSTPGRSANEANRSWIASSAKPTPPAAPAPGMSRTPRPATSSRRSAHSPLRASSCATSSGVAPFCGPKTAAAPSEPSSGFDTSHATSSSIRERAGSSVERSGAPSSCTRAPRPCRRPRPPSVVALPPIPSVTRRTPAAAAARSSWPVPMLVARTGSRSAGATRESPDASAISSTAASPSTDRSQRAVMGRPSGSSTGAACHTQPPAAAIASSVPSPPSASGARTISSDGRAAAQPDASARATWIEVNVPLYESGATSTRRRRSVPGGVIGPPRPPALPRPRAAVPGIRGCAASAGARGRPPRSPRG